MLAPSESVTQRSSAVPIFMSTESLPPSQRYLRNAPAEITNRVEHRPGWLQNRENPITARFCLCTTAASGLNAARSLTKQKLPMAKALSKSQIAATVSEKVGITGKLVLVNRKARMGRNPATGATIKIAAKRVVKFRVAKAAKDAILGTK